MMWILLLIAHLIADFFLQSANCAEKKTRKFKYLIGHALVYAVVMAIVLFAFVAVKAAWIPFVLIVVSHFLIDWIRVLVDRKWKLPIVHFGSFLVDQVLHVSIILALVYVFNLNDLNREWLHSLTCSVSIDQILRYILIFTIILDPAAVFIKKLTIFVDREISVEGQSKEPPIGRVIGKIERVIIVILVLCGEIATIGFVLAAKSLARFKQLDDKGFAEKYLIGTLSSTAIAICAALLLK